MSGGCVHWLAVLGPSPGIRGLPEYPVPEPGKRGPPVTSPPAAPGVPELPPPFVPPPLVPPPPASPPPGSAPEPDPPLSSPVFEPPPVLPRRPPPESLASPVSLEALHAPSRAAVKHRAPSHRGRNETERVMSRLLEFRTSTRPRHRGAAERELEPALHVALDHAAAAIAQTDRLRRGRV